MKTDRLYLEFVLECVRRIRLSVAAGEGEFLRSEIHQDAALRNLQVMAESTMKISSEARNRHPEVDWRSIAGFRNLLVHDYFGVDLHVILKVIREDMPCPESTVVDMLAECPPD